MDFKEYSELFHAAVRRSSSRTISRPSPKLSKMSGTDDAYLANTFLRVFHDYMLVNYHPNDSKKLEDLQDVYWDFYEEIKDRIKAMPNEKQAMNSTIFKSDSERNKARNFLSEVSRRGVKVRSM